MRVIHADAPDLQGTHYRILIGMGSLEALDVYLGIPIAITINFVS